MNTHRAVIASVFGASVLAVALLVGETPASTGGVMNLTATTANVGGAPDAVRIEVLRWSTNEERDRLVNAWNLKLPAPDAGNGRAGRGRGKAAGRGGRGPGRGAPAAEQEPLTPDGALARALQETTTVGYLWSSEIAGYALRFAGKESQPGRIAENRTDHRPAAGNDQQTVEPHLSKHAEHLPVLDDRAAPQCKRGRRG